MLTRLCAVCGRMVRQGQRCECQKHRHREYDREHRDKEKAAFYHSCAWARLREQVKARAAGCDEYIRDTEHRLVPGTIAHHIYPIDEHPELKLKARNLIYVSAKTHELFHAAYDKDEQGKSALQGQLIKIIIASASQERF